MAAPKSGTCGAGTEGDILEKFSDMMLRKDRETRVRDEADKRKKQELADRGFTYDDVTDTWKKTGPTKEEREKERATQEEEQKIRNAVECYFNRNYKDDPSYRIVTEFGQKRIERLTGMGWVPWGNDLATIVEMNRRAGHCG